MSHIRLIADCRCVLGEGILWDPSRQRLFWFDLARQQMLSCAEDGENAQTIALCKRISAAALAQGGHFAVAVDCGFGFYHPDKNIFSQVRGVEPDSNITNDGRCDPHGAFWFGTMEKNEQLPNGAIYRASRNGVKKVFADVTIPNAIAFSPDGKVMYWSDSPRRIIWRFDLMSDGEVQNRRIFVSLEGSPQVPDGATVDADGFLWNAEWDGGRVVRYDPNGKIDKVVHLPVSRPTCPVFGGDNLSVIYVSSAREGLSESELKKQPQAGGVFAFDAPVAALPPPVFGKPSRTNEKTQATDAR